LRRAGSNVIAVQRHRGRQRSLQAASRRLKLEVLEDRALLRFSPAANFAVGLNPQAMVAGDFNNDGKLDLATANTWGDVNVLPGDGQGGFGAAIGPETGYDGWLSQVSLSVADFNHDGNLDLAMAISSRDPDHWGEGWISVVLGNGDGTFRASPTPPSAYWKPLSLAVGDFNGDGNSDLVVSEDELNSFGYVEVLQGDGQGASRNRRGTT
jgi:hypothetical protein